MNHILPNRMSPEDARDVLQRASATARILESAVILIRPMTFARIMCADPFNLIQWQEPVKGAGFLPCFTDGGGECWPVTITESSYGDTQRKSLTALGREMRFATSPRAAAVSR